MKWSNHVVPAPLAPLSSPDVNQFLGSAQGALASLLERYSGAEITEKLSSSILATVTRQLVTRSSIPSFIYPSIPLLCFLFRI